MSFSYTYVSCLVIYLNYRALQIVGLGCSSSLPASDLKTMSHGKAQAQTIAFVNCKLSSAAYPEKYFSYLTCKELHFKRLFFFWE